MSPDDELAEMLNPNHHRMTRTGTGHTYECDQCGRLLVIEFDPPDLIVLKRGDFNARHSGGNVHTATS